MVGCAICSVIALFTVVVALLTIALVSCDQAPEASTWGCHWLTSGNGVGVVLGGALVAHALVLWAGWKMRSLLPGVLGLAATLAACLLTARIIGA